MVIGEFPSAEAAWEFTEEARASGHRVKLTDTARPVAKRSFGTAVVSALVLGSLFGVLGAYAEAGVVGLEARAPLRRPRGRGGGVFSGFWWFAGRAFGRSRHIETRAAARRGSPLHHDGRDGDGLEETARRHGGTFVEGQRLPEAAVAFCWSPPRRKKGCGRSHRSSSPSRPSALEARRSG